MDTAAVSAERGNGGRIIVVCSFRHAGSTMLGDALSASPSCRYVGETDRLLYGVQIRRTCSCGRDLADCSAWSLSGDRLDRFAARSSRRGSDPLQAPLSVVSTLVAGRPRGRLALRHHDVADQREVWASARAGQRLIVDSSKDLALVLGQAQFAPDRTTVVILTRDPMDTVNSSIRKGSIRKLAGAGRARTVLSAAADSMRIAVHLALVRRVCRAQHVPTVECRYEEFVAGFPASLVDLCARLGIAAPSPTPGDRTMHLPDRHMIWGNRGRTDDTLDVRVHPRDRGYVPVPLRALLTGWSRRYQRRIASDPCQHTRL